MYMFTMCISSILPQLRVVLFRSFESVTKKVYTGSSGLTPGQGLIVVGYMDCSLVITESGHARCQK